MRPPQGPVPPPATTSNAAGNIAYAYIGRNSGDDATEVAFEDQAGSKCIVLSFPQGTVPDATACRFQ